MGTWLKNLWKWLQLRQAGISFIIPLPSFYKNEDDMVKPSQPSDFDEEKIPDVAFSCDFKTGHIELIKRFLTLHDEYRREYPSRRLAATCVYRSPTEQKRLFQKGRFGNAEPRVTNCDGETKLSNHNRWPARALDIVVIDGGKGSYREELYWPLVALANKHGLVSGGSWDGFKDFPHLELPKDVV